jgi:hypothetical protein
VHTHSGMKVNYRMGRCIRISEQEMRALHQHMVVV